MNDFIYNQHDIPKEQYRYGLRASADVGCGWVATWNALQILGYKTDIPALIRYYEWQLPLIHGNTGTSFWGPAVCFRKWGFPVKVVVDTKRSTRRQKTRTPASCSTTGGASADWAPISQRCTTRRKASSATTPTATPPARTTTAAALRISSANASILAPSCWPSTENEQNYLGKT